MAEHEPFRFLDLPKDVRLMIYDILTVVITRHHTIKFRQTNEDFAITLVTKRIPGISILVTCTEIRAEATVLRKKIDTLNAEPLRIIAHWRTMGDEAMRAILRCASRKEGACPGNKELWNMLQAAEDYKQGTEPVVDMESLNRFNYFLTMRGLIPPTPDDLKPTITHSDIPTHEALHALLRHGTAPGTHRTMEMVVACTQTLQRGEEMLRTSCIGFYNWLSDMHQGWIGDVNIHINIRPMPESDAIRAALGRDYVFWNEYNPPSVFRGRKWRYELGEWVSAGQWAETWAEGEKG